MNIIMIIKKYLQEKSKNSYDKQRLINELIIHKSLCHPQIVSFENFFENKKYVCCLFEFCENQTLNELLKRRERLTEIEVQCYIYCSINKCIKIFI